LLVTLSPILLDIAIVIKASSPLDPVFFTQLRMGKNGHLFKLIKFRTMYNNASNKGLLLTQGKDDVRITRLGKVIRKLHIDEITQLINGLKGEMSLVGPRPEHSHYKKYYPELWEKVLQVKPGITGLTAVNLADFEYDLLTEANDVEEVYIKKVLPLKLQSDSEYIQNMSFINDIKIIIATMLGFIGIKYTINIV